MLFVDPGTEPDEFEALETLLASRMVPRRCGLQGYQFQPVPAFELATQMIAYASPESTYAVTRRLLDAARQSIVIGIYDFTADHMRDALLAAVRRGVQVTLMVDLDNRKGENETWAAVVEQGVEGIPAPSCASEHAAYFPSCHEKVIVIDDEWTLVQSGNWSDSSIPPNEIDGAAGEDYVPGNRDMGLAVRSRELAAFFSKVLRGDMQLELDAARTRAAAEEAVLPALPLAAAKPKGPPPQRFPSGRFRPRNPAQVVPVLSPDNYLAEVKPLLASARRSVEIEQQYIRGHQPEVRGLLASLRAAMDANPRLQVRVVLARPYGGMAEVAETLDALAEFGLQPGDNVRYLNPRYFVHCHNKLVVVDRKVALVGSQNWSDYAVSLNREASLLVRYAPLARYYQRIFDVDWDTGITLGGGARALWPEDAADRLAGGDAVPVDIGDYLEV